MKKTLLFTLFLFTPIFFFPQTPSDELKQKFDSIFLETATRIAPLSHDRALQIADSLYEHSSSKTFKLRALMLSATFHQNAGNIKDAIDKAKQAKKIANDTKNIEWKVRILGFLSTEYRNIGLKSERDITLQELLKTIPNIRDDDQRNVLYAMYYQELAFDHFDEYERENIIEFVHLAEKHLSELPESPNKTLFLGVNEWIYAYVYMEFENNADEALVHLDRASEFFEKADRIHYLQDAWAIYKGKAHFMRNEDSLAIQYFKQAEALSDASNNIYVKKILYEELQDFYRKRGDTRNLLVYLEKYSTLQNYIYNERTKPVEDLIESLKNEKESLSRKRLLFILLCVVLVLILLGTYIWNDRKRKQAQQQFQEIISELEKEKSLIPEPIQVIHKKGIKSKPQINEENYKKIHQGIKDFIKNEGYLQPNLNLADLASEINVNIKYLSQILNYEIGKDFNRFINECRIHYILDKLYTDKDYRLYKVSYLAEECGFSSHSKFSSVFKSLTKITPSEYIKFLNKEDEKQDAQESVENNYQM